MKELFRKSRARSNWLLGMASIVLSLLPFLSPIPLAAQLILPIPIFVIAYFGLPLLLVWTDGPETGKSDNQEDRLNDDR